MTDDWLVHFGLAALATWRVTHLLASEDGPAHLVFRLRRWLGDSPLGSLMDCFNCLSLWVAAIGAWFLATTLEIGLLSWLALSGAACLLERIGGQPDVEHGIHSTQGDDDVLR